MVVAVVLVLAGDVAVLVSRQGDGGERRPSGVAGELDLLLPELMAFVEAARGLPFRVEPDVELLADDEFETFLLEDEEADEESLADADAYLGLLRALGLIEGDVDLDQVGEEQAGDIVGFYDARVNRLYVRGTRLSPYVKEVLVHELVHALDDQHFDLDRDDLNDDDAAAFAALVEGSALWVEQQWFDSRPRWEQQEIEEAEGLGGPIGSLEDEVLPDFDVFDQLLSFPYDVGPHFVTEVLRSGQLPLLNQAFEDPPVTSEQVLHPERFLAGEAARPVANPAPDGPSVERGTLGELGLILVLAGALEHREVRRAAAGWGGDRYVVWEDGPQTCLRWNLVMDTAGDANEVVTALRKWVAVKRGASVAGSDPVVVTSCG